MTAGPNLRTLVLNQQYMPISLWTSRNRVNIQPTPYTISAKDAIIKYLYGGWQVVYFYDRKVLTPSRDDLYWPSAIISPDTKRFKKNEHVRLTKQTLFYRDHGVCCHCQKPLTINSTTYEHVIPKSAGGKKTWTNIAAACKPCNSARGDLPPTGPWKPKNYVYKPSYFDIYETRKKFPILIYDARWKEFLGSWAGEIIVRDKNIGPQQHMQIAAE